VAARASGAPPRAERRGGAGEPGAQVAVAQQPPELGGERVRVVGGEEQAARAAALLESQGYAVDTSPVLE
jgi:hypothetical protein